MPSAPRTPAAATPRLLHELLTRAAHQWPGNTALTCDGQHLTYAELEQRVRRVAAGLLGLGLTPGARVGVFLEKRLEAVVASFAVPAAGGVLVPLNPLLKPGQVEQILRDAEAQLIVTSQARWAGLAPVLTRTPALAHAVLCGEGGYQDAPGVCSWHALDATPASVLPTREETDLAAFFYTSGSTGQPKGVMLSHRNLVFGATSVASYLGNHEQDTLLAALPLSFDAGFSQLTTAFLVGARVVLLNYLLPRDVIQTMARERVTGLTAVPPLYIQLAGLDWPPEVVQHLRYWANTGGHMPRATLQRLRERVPGAKPYLMYGLTEAFRSTYLDPAEIDRRPDSIGRAIPHAVIHVLRDDGSECGPEEPGQLVHSGPLVAQGYWRRPDDTAKRFRELPAQLRSGQGMAVFSGDTVRRDADGFLYFVGRNDEMIKTSGYRVSPTEVEEVVHESGIVAEAIAVGMNHSQWGQAIHVAAVPLVLEGFSEDDASARLLAFCRERLPAYMVPLRVHWSLSPLPRNPNGKLDRLAWRAQHGGAS